jgi:hypothetical protein
VRVPALISLLPDKARHQIPPAAGLALATAVIILLLGLAFALSRETTYQSSVPLVLVPAPREQDDLATLLSSVERSGTIGTYVELISSADTLRGAGSPPVEIDVRAIPASRVVTVTAKGAKDEVTPAVEAVVTATEVRSRALGDLWRIRSLDRASAPVAEPPTTATMIGAVFVLAVLGGLFVFVAVSRVATPGGSRWPSLASREEANSRVARPVETAGSRASGRARKR